MKQHEAAESKTKHYYHPYLKEELKANEGYQKKVDLSGSYCTLITT
jgi:hypothetical protein